MDGEGEGMSDWGGGGGGGTNTKSLFFMACTHIPFSNRLTQVPSEGPPLAQRTALRSQSPVRERGPSQHHALRKRHAYQTPNIKLASLERPCPPRSPLCTSPHCMSLRGMTAPVTPVKAEVEFDTKPQGAWSN